MEVVASLSQGRTAAAQCGLFTHKSVPDIFEPPCITARKEFPIIYTAYSVNLHQALTNVRHQNTQSPWFPNNSLWHLEAQIFFYSLLINPGSTGTSIVSSLFMSSTVYLP